METFKDQMNKLHNPKVDYDKLYPVLSEWTLDDYKSMFEFISMGYLVQANDSIGFVINEEWDDDDDEPMWVVEDEEGMEFCDYCGDGLIQDSSEPYCEGVNCASAIQMIPFEHTSAIRQVNKEMKTLNIGWVE